MKKRLFLLIALLANSGGLTTRAAVETVDIAPTGVTVNGSSVSGTTADGAVIVMSEKALIAAGQPLQSAKDRDGHMLLVWNGVGLMPDADANYFFLTLASKVPNQPLFRGSLSIEGVPVNADTTISVINASLDKDVFTQSQMAAWGSLWQLQAGTFAIRISCDEGGKPMNITVIRTKAPAGLEDGAKGFLQLLQDKKYKEAFEIFYFFPKQRGNSAEKFESWIEKDPVLSNFRSFTIVSAVYHRGEGLVTAQLEEPDGDAGRVTVNFQHADLPRRWKPYFIQSKSLFP